MQLLFDPERFVPERPRSVLDCCNLLKKKTLDSTSAVNICHLLEPSCFAGAQQFACPILKPVSWRRGAQPQRDSPTGSRFPASPAPWLGCRLSAFRRCFCAFRSRLRCGERVSHPGPAQQPHLQRSLPPHAPSFSRLAAAALTGKLSWDNVLIQP